MIDPRGGRRAVVHLVLALAVLGTAAGCSAAPSASEPATTSPGAVPTASATPASPPPVADSPTPPATSPPGSAPASAGEPSLETPPAAALVAAGASHPGEPGSWTWAGVTSDAPWLPAQALVRADVPAGTVTVTMDEDLEVESWTAVAATADDTQGLELEPLGDGAGQPSFRLAGGEWVVAVDVRFADGLGSAVYYWHLVVT